MCIDYGIEFYNFTYSIDIFDKKKSITNEKNTNPRKS